MNTSVRRPSLRFRFRIGHDSFDFLDAAENRAKRKEISPR